MAKEDTIRIGVAQALTWPQVCALCLNTATKEEYEVIENRRVSIPYCDDCYPKVRRLRVWKENIFGVALIIGAIGLVLALIGGVIQDGWLALLRGRTWIGGGAAGFLFMGAGYAIAWLLLLPLRLIFHARLAAPGVKVRKSKEPGVAMLKFSNLEYAARFRQVNGLTI
jgi:hypothetical protein